MTMSHVRGVLRDAVAASGLTPTEVARRAGIAEGSMRNLLAEARAYHRQHGQSLDDARVRRTLARVAKVLGVNIQTLIPAPDAPRLGEALRLARLARGQSQEWVAGAVGLAQPTLWRIESHPGYYSTPELLDALADYLGVPVWREVDPALVDTAAAPCAVCGQINDPTRIWCGRCGTAVPLFPRKDTEHDDDDNAGG